MSTETRSYHHGDLRAQLLARAAELIARDGPEAFSLRAVAAELGVSHTAPRHHFGDRRGVFTALATIGNVQLADVLAAATPSGFGEVAAAYVRFAVDHPGHVVVMHRPDLLHDDDRALGVARERVDRRFTRAVTDAAVGSPYEVAVKVIAARALVDGLALSVLGGTLARDRLVGDDPDDLRGLVLAASALLDLARTGDPDDPFRF